MHWQNAFLEISGPQNLLHQLQLVTLNKLAGLKNDRVADTFYAVFNQEVVGLAIAVHKEILSADLCHHEFDVELSCEIISLSQFKDCLFQMVVGR